jgi:D-alanyl-D-alanine carboxypeptidase/D-alanyl-D-alanine carboxypeptidase (penicillin-binding protein 5/6)
MKKNHFLMILIVIATILLAFPAAASAAPSVGIPADIAYILIDSKTGQVLAEQNADQQLGPASTTKILTAIVAIETGDPEQEMKVSLQAVNDIGRGGMNIGIMAGETGLTLDNMLHAMLIKSANETANIIAENLAPSRSEFVERMNAKAKELGAVNTHFVNPCGKDTEAEDAGHLTTARDLSIIARYAMTLPKFREIVGTEYYKEMPVTDKHDDWGILRNTNQFLWYDNTYPYSLDGVDHKYTVNGIKTGYTVAAGNNLISSAVGEDGMELIAVVMHVTQPNKIYGYSKELLRYGFEHYSMQKICTVGQAVSNVTVEGGKDGSIVIGLQAKSEVSGALPIGADPGAVEMKVNVASPAKAPVSKGDVLGSVEYRNNGVLLGKSDLVADRAVEASPAAVREKEGNTQKPVTQPDSSYSYILLGILVVLSLLVVTRIILRRISRKMRKKRYEQKYYNSREID